MRIFNFFKNNKKIKEDSSLLKIPEHIAIIPDGNRRWAAMRGLPKEAGHREGAYNFKRIVIAASKMGVKHITFYAFSTENWSRDEEEVKSLMNLMLNFLRNAEKEIEGNNVVIKVIGNIEPLSEELKKEIKRVEKITSVNDGTILYLAINYGGRDELLHAAKNIALMVKEGLCSIEDIDFDMISSNLYTKGCPDPDLLIRTSGEMRTSNFLPWQMAYTEFWFTDTLWPDFSEKELKRAIIEYGNRKRRFGGK